MPAQIKEGDIMTEQNQEIVTTTTESNEDKLPCFADLKFERNIYILGYRAYMEFPNKYGVSVIQGAYSYGGDKGLYELAVMKDGHLCYDTPITSDVIGHLTEEEVTEIMQQVANL